MALPARFAWRDSLAVWEPAPTTIVRRLNQHCMRLKPHTCQVGMARWPCLIGLHGMIALPCGKRAQTDIGIAPHFRLLAWRVGLAGSVRMA